MTLAPHEFIRRFLIHVLPKGFHRIRHYGLFANGNRAESIAKARELLAVAWGVKHGDIEQMHPSNGRWRFAVRAPRGTRHRIGRP